MGRGNDEPDRQHALQRAPPYDFTSNYDDTPDDAGNHTAETLKERIGFRIHSRLHEMCEFLKYDGADYRHLPPNGGPEI